jgi:hypothetical protein
MVAGLSAIFNWKPAVPSNSSACSVLSTEAPTQPEIIKAVIAVSFHSPIRMVENQLMIRLFGSLLFAVLRVNV